ncbi:MAG: hypothetical protein OXT03_01250, partial [Alphaproteobacteria bacterium]|nr:hypothetical protein [Alphaproteobacteria bacterium]
MAINKKIGKTATEQFLAKLCENTFLSLWAYPDPCKSDSKEICDVIAIFENHVFLFFDRKSQTLNDPKKDIDLQWQRWVERVIQKQIKTAMGATRYIERSPDKIFIDPKCSTPLPISIPSKPISIHRIIVAHGAKEFIEKLSSDNISGSLGIKYNDLYSNNQSNKPNVPGTVFLERTCPVHVFDSHNLEIILGELDTFYDFKEYLLAKEKAIKFYDRLEYCGEEDLLAHYWLSSTFQKEEYSIIIKDKPINNLSISEGKWKDVTSSYPYKIRKKVYKESYFWDDLILMIGKLGFKDELLGNANIFNVKNPIYEMAKEPRSSRVDLSENILRHYSVFSKYNKGFSPFLNLVPSFYHEKGYVFLHRRIPNQFVNDDEDYESERYDQLQVACGVVKNKFPYLQKIIGIAFDRSEYNKESSEIFILLD